jgi:protein gp37
MAREDGVRWRVFCASLGDVFEDRPELHLPRFRLFDLIRGTPNLDWLLLTKRPANVAPLLAAAMDHAYGVPQIASEHAEWLEGWLTGLSVPPNVWLGVSVEDQQRANERIPILLRTPAAVRFISAEPLLDLVDLTHCYSRQDDAFFNAFCGQYCGLDGWGSLDWVILGGESGGQARPCRVEGLRWLVAQCQHAGVACFVKQLGASPQSDDDADALSSKKGGTTYALGTLLLRDSKGAEPDEWPVDLQVREFPNVNCRGGKR